MARYNSADIARMKEYRAVFTTESGKKVLKDILIRLKVFETINPVKVEDIALHNFGIFLLYQIGAVNDETTDIVLDKLMSIEYTPKEIVNER